MTVPVQHSVFHKDPQPPQVISVRPYSGLHFRPNTNTRRNFVFVPEGPKFQAGSGTGRFDIPIKSQWPFSK